MNKYWKRENDVYINTVCNKCCVKNCTEEKLYNCPHSCIAMEHFGSIYEYSFDCTECNNKNLNKIKTNY